MPRFQLAKKITLAPMRKKVLIFDSPLEGLIREAVEMKFGPSDFGLFDPRFRTVALIPLVLALIGFGRLGREALTVRYFVWFLRFAQPELLISGAHNNEFLYRGKVLAKLPGLRLIVFQNGHSSSQQIPQLDGFTAKDRVFCISESYVQIFRDRLGGVSAVASGTLGSLKFKETMNRSPGELKHVGFISPRSGPPEASEDAAGVVRDMRGQLVPEEFFFRHDLDFLNRIIPTLQTIGCTLRIIGSSIDYPVEEESFYRKHLQNSDWVFSARTSILSSYACLTKVDLVVCSDSTLGFEALSMGKPVAFIEAPGSILNSRNPTLYPSHKQSPRVLERLIIRSNESDAVWLKKLRELAHRDSIGLEELASQVLGKEVLDYSSEDLLNELFSEYEREM